MRYSYRNKKKIFYQHEIALLLTLRGLLHYVFNNNGSICVCMRVCVLSEFRYGIELISYNYNNLTTNLSLCHYALRFLGCFVVDNIY